MALDAAAQAARIDQALAVGALQEALRWAEEAAREAPLHAGIAYRLGLVLLRLNRAPEAFVKFAIALREQPLAIDVRLALAQTYMALNDGWSAAAWLSDACRVAPHAPQLWMELARVLKVQQRDSEIEATLRCGVLANPADAGLLETLAERYLGEQRYAEALPVYQALLAQQPRDAKSLLHCGFCLEQTYELDAAIARYREALAQQPDLLEAHIDLSGVLWRVADFQGALQQARKALALAPRQPHALRILGTALMHLNRLEEADAALRQALAQAPDLAPAKIDHAMLLLLAGRFGEGWAAYQRRWEDTRRMPRPSFFRAELEWQGPARQPPRGKRIVVYSEQGLGDALQFIRYVLLLQADGAMVYAVMQPALVPLIESIEGLVCLKPELTIEADHHVALLDLPLHYRTQPLDPADRLPRAAYLRAPAARTGAWRERLQRWSGDFKIGIAWAGNAVHPNDRNRSYPLSEFRPLLELPLGVQCFRLQKSEARAQADLAVDEAGLPDFTPQWADFGDSAAMLEQLDLVIGVDSAVVHLAGALGRPVWALLPPNPDWRWLLERGDSPWYPTMRLFRRDHAEPRAAQMARVVQALQEHLQRHAEAAPA